MSDENGRENEIPYRPGPLPESREELELLMSELSEYLARLDPQSRNYEMIHLRINQIKDKIEKIALTASIHIAKVALLLSIVGAVAGLAGLIVSLIY
jgi:hypothetical protein